MNLDGVDNNPIDMSKLTIADKWILNTLNETVKLVNDNVKNYRIGEMAHVLYDFFWNQYCDWYVEIAKIQLQDENLKLNTQRMLKYVLDMSLRLLHPIMPHITEAIWQLIPQEKEAVGIIRAEYPTFKKEFVFEKENIETLANISQRSYCFKNNIHFFSFCWEVKFVFVLRIFCLN